VQTRTRLAASAPSHQFKSGNSARYTVLLLVALARGRTNVRGMHLPDYHPPSDQRASIAVGLAPLFVLIAFAAIVTRVIDADTGFAIFVACTLWVVFEMHHYQTTIDRYNQEYVEANLSWRSPATLQSLAAAAGTPEPTREFVERFLSADGEQLVDRPTM
jgi:hypothetical protein